MKRWGWAPKCWLTTPVSAPRYAAGVDAGLYESLLTERLHAALAARPDLHADIGTVDEAEQAMTIARHLTPLIERQLRSPAARRLEPSCCVAFSGCWGTSRR